MKKLTLVLVSLVYVISLLSVAAFAAESKQTTSGQKTPKAAYTDVQLEQMRALNPVAKKPAANHQTSLGFLLAPGVQLGATAYDIQHNSAMGRQIAVGPDQRVHAVWTQKDVAVATRETRYTSINAPYGAGNVSDPGGSPISDAREGHMCNVDQINNLALAVWRYGGGFAAYRSTSALENFVGTGSFTTVDLPNTGATCEGIFAGTTAEPYIWPKVAGDRDGSLNPVSHVVAMEGNSGSDMSGIAYYKGTGGTFTNYGTCGRWIDSTQAISYSIAQDPNSDKVAIAYQKSRDEDDGSRDNGDAAYRMSLDNGNTWQPVVNITNYPTAGKERAVQEASCLFSADGCFHVVFVATVYDTSTGVPEDYVAKLYHYDDCKDCISLVLDANNEDTDCDMKAFERAVSRVTISECYDGPDTNLYVVYTRYLGDNNPATAQGRDCSDNGHPNGEIFAQASSDSKKGETWGPAVNLTNTPSNGCLPGACEDDNFATSAKYATGFLHIEYMNDRDAGSFVGNESASSDETSNPIMYLNSACFDMADNYALSATPSGLLYPTLHAAPGGSDQDTVTLTNAGNVNASWTRTISYGVGSGWLSLATNGTVTSGCSNTSQLLITASAAALSEGYYTATITFNYGISSSFVFPVEFHVWNNFFLPQYTGIRTSLARLAVSQAGRTSAQLQNNQFYFFSDQSQPFYDGSLVLGNSATNLSWLIFAGQNPTVNNPFGPLYAQSNTTYDSTTFIPVAGQGYRFATGRGSNRDSTLSYIVNYYAPAHPDSSKAFTATYKLFKGPKNAGGSITGLTIAYAVDMDVKDDSSENRGGADVARQAMWQRGVYAANVNRYAGIRGFRRDNVAISGGFVSQNDEQIYPLSGWENDSMWNKLAATTGYTFPDSSEDLNTVLVIQKNATVNGATNDTLRFGIVWAATESGGLVGLQQALDRGKQFICGTGREYNGTPVCAACKCGDADNNATWSIADAVYLINYIFAGGPPPGAPGPLQVCLGDADGNKSISIADAVYLINFIFAGGPAPGGC